jgi:hypothetical protein
MDKPRVGDQLHMHRARSTVAGDLTHTDRLRDAIGAMYASGSDAQALYEQAAKTLKREPEAMMVAIIAAYGGCQPRDYSQRQALVQAAAVIGHKAAVPFLASVALSEIPPEISSDSHGFSTVAEETIIRTTAVDALTEQARAGERQVIEELIRCVASPSFSLRRAAVTGLMSLSEGKNLRRRLEALVPKDQHFVFALKKTPVRQALQVKDPTRHLTHPHYEFSERKPDVAGRGDGRPPKTPVRSRGKRGSRGAK